MAIDLDLPLPGFPSLRGQGAIAIDCETKDPELKEKGSGCVRPGCHVVGVAVGTEAGYRAYYPVRHEDGPNLPPSKVFGWLKQQLRDGEREEKVGAHLLYDAMFLAKEGIELRGPLRDVQIAEPLLDESRLNYQLETIARDYLGVGKADEEMDAWLVQKFGKKNPKSNIWRAPYCVVAPYAIGDVSHPLEIFAKQREELKKQDLWELFDLESRLIPMLLAMRQRGVRVDLDLAEQNKKKFSQQRDAIVAELRRRTGVDVQIWAADSLAKMFDDLGIKYALTPKTKKPSFTAAFLKLCPAEEARLIVEARQLDKLVNTFVLGCILDAHVGGRVHCQFNQLKGEDGGAVSGRFSSSNPNLQFIPVRTEDGKMIRMMFLADEGQRWWKKDYSQIEFRLVVHDAVDLNLRGAREVADEFIRNPDADFHQAVADMAQVSRSFAKTINFGLIYGEGVNKLCDQLGMTLEEGEEFLRTYHSRVPFVKPLADQVKQIANRTGEVVTLLKRRRRFPWVSVNKKTGQTFVTKHRIPGAKRGFTHAALNARVQGSAADVMKKAMVDSWEAGVYADLGGCPQLTVHDELDGSDPGTKKSRVALAELNDVMRSTVELNVPLRVDAHSGKSWGECK